jgi:hypothetical protein
MFRVLSPCGVGTSPSLVGRGWGIPECSGYFFPCGVGTSPLPCGEGLGERLKYINSYDKIYILKK